MTRKILLAVAFLFVATISALAIWLFSPQPLDGDLSNAEGDYVGHVHVSTILIGVKIVITAHNLPPGPHAVHLYQADECMAQPFRFHNEGNLIVRDFISGPDDYASLGRHLNPTSNAHGFENPSGHHAGDFDHDLLIDASGQGRTTYVVSYLSLNPETGNDVTNKQLALDERGDDQHTDPDGNSGRHIACAFLVPPLLRGTGL